ncbi:MAG: hypothetical protein IID32_05515 [Planctomycetes bacterium]|nr:hypothetical protein [Planctomycetota bacterium]
MDKTELIDAVRRLNTTASVEFLSQFSSKDLQEYVSNLEEIERPSLPHPYSPGAPFN